MRSLPLPLLVSAAVALASCGGREPETALAVFEQRILPILNSPKPSSCSECHLSGVDLKDYIRKDQKETFASLVAAGLADPKNPDGSKLLTFIARKPETPWLVPEEVRKEEYEAFRAWLNAAAKEPGLLAAGDAGKIGPTLPAEVVRHARADRVLASFVENVWAESGRCAACHSPDKNAEQVAKHGEQVSWITPGDPAATMRHMLDAGIIDVEYPDRSLLLTKPTEQVKHGGGQKMVVGDRTYKQFRRFLDDYSATAFGRYGKADELPEPGGEVSVATEIWLKITDVPESYDKMLLQADLHRWQDGRWSEERWATSDRPVFGKGKLWQHSLSLTAPRGSERAGQIGKEQTIPPGRYLVKLYVDRAEKLSQDFRAEMGEAEFVGEVEVDSRWPIGYGEMTEVKFPGR